MGRRSTGGTTTKQRLIESWDAEESAKKIEEEIEAPGRRGQLVRRQSILDTEKSFNSTWWTQYTVLVHRSMKNSRSAIFTTMNLIKGECLNGLLTTSQLLEHQKRLDLRHFMLTSIAIVIFTHSRCYWLDVRTALASDAVHRVDCI